MVPTSVELALASGPIMTCIEAPGGADPVLKANVSQFHRPVWKLLFAHVFWCLRWRY